MTANVLELILMKKILVSAYDELGKVQTLINQKNKKKNTKKK